MKGENLEEQWLIILGKAFENGEPKKVKISLIRKLVRWIKTGGKEWLK